MQMMLPQAGLSRPFTSAAAGDVKTCPTVAPQWLSLDTFVASERCGESLYVQVEGDSMRECNINHGDVLVVHARAAANSGDTVLARFGENYVVKRFRELEPLERRRRFALVPANPDYNIRLIEEHDDFEIIGVVTYVLKRIA